VKQERKRVGALPMTEPGRASGGREGMNAKQDTVVRYIDELEKVGGLKGSDIANIAQVSKATVSRWVNGAMKPRPHMQLILSDLHYIVGRLQEYYSADEIRIWLYARHPQLEGERAIDLINRGESERILNILDRLDAETYL
jgi:transcriptional regulator with XRE-family HTH domain